jgi:hypothetical protein
MADYFQVKNQNIFNPPANTSLGNATNQFDDVYIQNDLVLGNTTVTGATIVTPKVSTIGYPGDDTAADPAGGQTITLTGSGFLVGASVLINGSAVGVVSVVSSTTITFTSPANATGSYVLYVINTDGGTAIAIPGIQYSGVPTWTTAAGSLGSVYETQNFNSTVTATGDAPITYSLFSGSIPPGATFNSNGTITGTSQVLSSSTTYTFTVRATDAEAQDTDRSFSLTINPDVVTWSSPANGTTYTSTANSAISNVTLSATSAVGSGITYTANALPTGLSLTGANISGTPTVEANSSSLLTATANTTSESSSITINWVIGVANDTFFEYNTLLIPGASTTFVDDASTNNFAVTINGDTKPNSFNPYTPGYYSNYFDGLGDWLTIPNNTGFAFGSGEFTVEMWVYITGSSGTVTNYSNGQSSNSNFGWELYQVNTTTMQFSVFEGATQYISSSTSFKQNAWNHIACVRSSNTLTTYVNGVAGGTTANVTGVSINDPASATLKLCSYGNGSDYVTGYISNFRVVKGTAVYTAAFTPSTTPLTAISGTSVLTCQSNRFIDNSASTLTITVTGNTLISSFDPFVPNSSYSTYGSGYFDGTGDYLSVDDNSAFALSNSNFTMEAWIYPTATGDYPTIAAQYGTAINSSFFWSLGPTANPRDVYFIAYLNGNTVTAQASNVVVLNTWSHHAVVRNSGTLTYYINGVSVSTASIGSSSLIDSTRLFTIGNSGDSVYTSYPFTGYITNVRVVKGTAVYTGNFTPPTAPLTAIANTSLLTLQNNQSVNNSVFLDNSTNNFLVTRAGNATQGTFSPYGGNWSNYFDGTGDYLTVGANANLSVGTSDFTIEAWVNLASGSAYQFLMGSSANGGMMVGISVPLGTPSSTIAVGTHNVAWVLNFGGSIPIVSNTWTHVAITRSGTTNRAFINGVQLGSNITDSTNWAFTSNAPYIAYNAASGNLTGYISNLRVVKGTAVYTSAFTPSTTPLTPIANTALLTCADNRLVDESVNNLTITKNGDVSVQRFSPFSPSSVTPTSYSGYFDGSGDYLSGASWSNAGVFGTSDFTVECWVYATGAPQSNQLIWGCNIYPNTTGLYLSYFGSGGTNLGLRTGATTLIDSSAGWAFNTWLHVAVVRSGSTLTLYINGTSRGSTTFTNNCSDGLQYIGRPSDTTNFAMQGSISNFRIVKGTAVYTGAFTPSTTPLTAISGTSLLTLQSPTFIDNSTNNFTITAVGNSQPSIQNPFGFTSTTTNGYTVSTIGGSGYFDGTGDYLTFPNNAVFAFGTGSYTIEFWINGPLNNNNFILSGRAAIGTMHITTGGYESTAGVLRYIGSSTILSSNVITDNTWHHCAIVRNGSSNITLYVDGVSVGTGTDTTNYTNTTGTWYIASNDISVPSNIPTAYISDLRIVRGTAVYTSNFVPPPSPLTPIQNSSLLLNMTSAGIYDASMMNNMETVADAKLSTAVSKFGGSSMAFDGTGDYLTMPNSPNLNLGSGDFTIEAWIYLNSMVESSAVVSKGSNGQFLIFIGGNNELSFYASTTGSGWTITDLRIVTSPSLSTWHHIAVTRAGSTVKTFFNGITANSTTLSGSLVSQSTPVLVGYYNASFNGYIDDLRITKGVARYTSNFTPATSAFPIF